jgi:O-antigen/teichoic acid export membrane protein
MACSITLIAPSAAFQSIFVAIGKNTFIALVSFLGSIFSFFLALILFKFTDTNHVTLFLVVVSSSIFSTFILGIRAVKLIPLKIATFNRSSFGNFFNLGSFLISVGAPLAFQLDRILIVSWGSVNDALESAPVNRMVASVTLILSAAAMSFWPYLKLRKNNEIVKKYMVNSFIVAIPFTISIFLIGPYLVQYVSSGKILFSLMSQASVAFFLLSYSMALVPILVLSDRTGQLKVFISMTLNAGCTVLTCFFLIPKYGLAGYYLSSGLCTIICVVIPLYLIAVKQLTQEQIDER